MSKCKAKAIQTDLGTLRHNQGYPGIILHIRTLCYPDIFKTVVYAEHLHTQNEKHLQHPGILTILIC